MLVVFFVIFATCTMPQYSTSFFHQVQMILFSLLITIGLELFFYFVDLAITVLALVHKDSGSLFITELNMSYTLIICFYRSRTNVHYLVFHLTVADAITSFITLPMETIWRATIGVRK